MHTDGLFRAAGFFSTALLGFRKMALVFVPLPVPFNTAGPFSSPPAPDGVSSPMKHPNFETTCGFVMNSAGDMPRKNSLGEGPGTGPGDGPSDGPGDGPGDGEGPGDGGDKDLNVEASSPLHSMAIVAGMCLNKVPDNDLTNADEIDESLKFPASGI